MKDYYQILEVNKTASPEVIDRVYKLLAKKYHPDLQEASNVQEAEEKFKEISEAYEILSDEEKRKAYDLELQFSEDSEKASTVDAAEFQKLRNYAAELEDEISYLKNASQPSNSGTSNYINNNFSEAQNRDYQNSQNQAYQEAQNRAYQDAVNKAYHDTYINSLKNMGYKIKYKKTFGQMLKNFVALVLTAIIISIIAFIVWHIPALKERFLDLFMITK